MEPLDSLRRQIDEIDAELVALLNKRAEVVLKVRDTKQRENITFYSPGRERQILERVKLLAKDGHFPTGALERIFITIVSATRSIGELVVSYLGPESSRGYEAALSQFGSEVNFRPAADIAAVFKQVQCGDAHYGVVPIERAFGALVSETLQMLLRGRLNVVAEIEMHERLTLLAQCGLSEVTAIYADAASFVVAQNWLSSNLPAAQQILAPNPVVAAANAAKSDNAASIGTQLIAERTELQIIADMLEGSEYRLGRYFVIGDHETSPCERDKTSLFCEVVDRPGALCSVLRVFAESDISLTKIESRVLDNTDGHSMFFVEVSEHKQGKKMENALKALEELCSRVKIVGSYPIAH